MGIKATVAIQLTAILVSSCLISSPISAQQPVPLLILSGQNNHDWQKTTPVLENIFLASGLFTVTVTNRPDTLKYSDYKRFRLIVWNWNSWPDTSTRWNSAKEEAFTRYMREGGGALFMHAGGSSFYGWQEYQKIAIGRWGKNTSHGAIGPARISMGEWEYPFSFRDFDITDEIWVNTEISSSARELATAQKMGTDGKPEVNNVPALLTARFGQGRSVYTMLGHDANTMANAGFREMLLKAAGWAARTEVSSSGYFGTLQFPPKGKPHFHPLISPNHTILTEESPNDHPWHMGLWFSWKFIDGLNYWEYAGDPKMHISEGMTDIQIFNTDIVPPHASLAYDLDVLYHPWDKPGEPVMAEVQRDTVSFQDPDGSYHIDYDFTFTALKDLTLDRTPIPGEPGGQSWGGYSGMSMRLNNAFRDVRYFTTNNEPVPYGKTARWVACEFNNEKGRREQVIIFDNPDNPRYPSPWYCINDSATPMYFFSPAILYKEPLKLKKEETLHLKYRIYLPARVLSASEINDLPIR